MKMLPVVTIVAVVWLATSPVSVLGQPKATAESAVQIPSTPVGKLLSQWLETFNSGDKDTIQKFQAEHLDPAEVKDPARRLGREMGLRQQTGGFELEKIESSTDRKITGIVKEQNSDRRARIMVAVSDSNPQWIGDFDVQLVGGPPQAQGPPPAKVPVDQLTKDVDGKLTELAAADKFSGAALLAKDGKIIWQKAYGLANREAQVANTVDTRFRLGSMNKMFTAVAIAQLVQQGKLKFTDTLAHALPDYPNKDVANKITVEQMLTHTSGLGDFFTPEFDQKKDSLHELKDYLPLFVNKPLDFEPGKDWRYSNAGFLVLGLIIEKVSGESYYDYVKKHIYDVAGMKDSGSPPPTEKVANLAVGYTRGGDEGEDDPKGPLRPNTGSLPWRGSSAGGGDSTVGDLLKFDQALRSNRLLSPEMTRLVTTGKVHPPQMPEGTQYAYGFGEKVVDGKRVVGHNGGAPGMNAELDMHLDTGYTVVVLANRDPSVAVDWARYITARLP
ncbi:MAG: beta-lactamase family protein [Acidobacteria bacterium]|nr:beta-lactamase family protein [Acidobacteriota bacterium]